VHPLSHGEIFVGTAAQDADRILDRRERVTQLVAQYGEELVFKAIRGDEFFNSRPGNPRGQAAQDTITDV
jgi:hypothetical protein